MYRLLTLSVLMAMPRVVAHRAEAPHHQPPVAVANDNRHPAGHFVGDTLVVDLEIALATWHPEGPDVQGFTMPVFAERGQAPTIPGPLLRVREGTPVRVTLTNALPQAVRLRGLQDRSRPVDTLTLGPASTVTTAFVARGVGTWMYMGRTGTESREIGRGPDAQLVGAFIVDPAGSVPAPNERVLVITAWDDSIPNARYRTGYAQAFALNGRAWPTTERLRYTMGDTVEWRVVNASSHSHPMHLHGMPFTVLSQGTSAHDTLFAPGNGRHVVTHYMRAATTVRMRWVAEHPGHWLFHCHSINHIETALRLAPGHHETHGRVEDAMAGMVMAIEVRGARSSSAPPRSARRLDLWVTEGQTAADGHPRYGFVAQQGPIPRADSVRSPGSTLVLREGEPTQITVHNRASTETAIHWHGMELESYYDGVPAWSGTPARRAPAIAPGDSFVVRITPARAGTYIYHTHAHERRQLLGGMYGALLVLPRGARADLGDDALIVLSDRGIERPDAVVSDTALRVPTGRAGRVRIVSIPAQDILRVRLVQGDRVLSWRPVAKDGMDLPPHQAVESPGDVFLGPGETLDVELSRVSPGTQVELSFPGQPQRPASRLPLTSIPRR